MVRRYVHCPSQHPFYVITYSVFPFFVFLCTCQTSWCSERDSGGMHRQSESSHKLSINGSAETQNSYSDVRFPPWCRHSPRTKSQTIHVLGIEAAPATETIVVTAAVPARCSARIVSRRGRRHECDRPQLRRRRRLLERALDDDPGPLRAIALFLMRGRCGCFGAPRPRPRRRARERGDGGAVAASEEGP